MYCFTFATFINQFHHLAISIYNVLKSYNLFELLFKVNLLKSIEHMHPENIRQKLYQYVDKGDDKLLKLMYALAKEYAGEDDFEYAFSDEEIKLLEDRRVKRLIGESKTYSLQEAKDIVTGKNKI